MKRFVFLVVIAGLVAGCGFWNQGDAENDERRKGRILANLKLHYPQLREADVVMGDLQRSTIGGLDRGSFTIAGTQTLVFLVSREDEKLILLTREPIDVGLSEEQVEAQIANDEEAAAEEAERTRAKLDDIADGWPQRGRADAPVTIVEFSDFQCPFCARAHATVVELLQKYPDDVRLVYAHFPLPNHRWARPAAIASVCAANQNADVFWDLHDWYFEQQQQIDSTSVVSRSREFLKGTGININAWSACASDPSSAAYVEAAELVDAMMQAGENLGVSATPGFFVNGHFLEGAQPLSRFEKILARSDVDVR